MIIGGLIALFSILFGGPESALFLDDFGKNAKKYVEDETRRQRVLSNVKSYNSMVKAHNKRAKGAEKQLDRMLIDPLVTPESFDLFFEARIVARMELQETYITMRLDVASSMTNEEWDQVIAASKEKYEKSLKDMDKSMDKLDAELDKVEAAVLKKFESEESKTSAASELEGFKTRVNELAQHHRDFNFYQEPVLMRRNASAGELHEGFTEANTTRKAVYEAFIESYFGLKEIANDEEWEGVAKQLKKFY